MGKRNFRQQLANWLYKEAEISKENFVSFPCSCGEQVLLSEYIMPGQAAVLDCQNCKVSWTVYNPTLIVKKTKEVPENLQKVWAEISQ